MLASSPAFAKDWIYCRSAHFEGYQEVTEPGHASCALDVFEQYWDLFSYIYGTSAETRRPVRFMLFHHLDGPEGSDSPVGRGEALVVRSETRDYVIVRDERPTPRPAKVNYPDDHDPSSLLREPLAGFRLMRGYIRLRLSEFSLPVWFAAGLEDFYLDPRWKHGLFELQDFFLDPRWKDSPLKLVRRRDIEHPTVDKLLAAAGTPRTFGVTAFGGKRDRYRSKASALVGMLHTHRDYAGKYREFFSTLVGGASSEDAFQQIYGKSPEQVNRDLRDSDKTAPWTYAAPARPETPPTSVRPASDTERSEMLKDMQAALASGDVQVIQLGSPREPIRLQKISYF
jgi:hypothetical protein